MSDMSSSMAELYQTQLEASRYFGGMLFANTKKIDRLVIDAAHHALAEHADFVQSIAAARDPQGIASAQITYFSRRPDSVFGYQKELMRIFSEMQNDIGRSIQEYAGKVGGRMTRQVSTPINAVPQHTVEAARNSAATLTSVWESAFRDAASLANGNLAAAQSAFKDTENATVNKVRKTVQAASDHSAETAHHTAAYRTNTRPAADVHSANGRGNNRASSVNQTKAHHAKKTKLAATKRG